VICVVQFDSASEAVVERMLGEGRLPALAELLGRGRRVELATPASEFAAGAFPTLYSGVHLADHGVVYPFQWSPEAQRALPASRFHAPAGVWERLAAHGLRTLAIDPYECRPPGRALGTFVSGWGFRERVVLPRWSRPRPAARRLALRHGTPPVTTEIFGAQRPAHLLRLRERLLAAPGRVSSLALDLLGRERFDLAWLTFSAAHLGGHAFWDLSQVPEEGLDEGERAALSAALEEIYAAVDRAIGEVVAALGSDDHLLVVSPVGMDVNTSRADLLPEMLAAVLSGGPLPEQESAGAIWRLRGAIPPSARERVAAALPRPLALDLTARLELRGHDWAATRAFAHPADNQGYVRFNLRGRERDGIVDPGAVADLTGEIRAGLGSFRDPDGSPSVASVDEVAELHRGRRSGQLPDLVVRWSERPSTRLEQVSSDEFGTVRRHGAGSGRSGNHTPGGAWAVLVPGAGASADPGPEPHLVDVAATICELAGAPPADLPGRPLAVR
jgi:predicted AlkP superfamily phosphohydrolase/phosphomutase